MNDACVNLQRAATKTTVDKMNNTLETSAFKQWLVCKHARQVRLVVLSETKNCLVCVYHQYKSNLKNLGKSNFDAAGSAAAKRAFNKWYDDNGVHDHAQKCAKPLLKAYTQYKKSNRSNTRVVLQKKSIAASKSRYVSQTKNMVVRAKGNTFTMQL